MSVTVIREGLVRVDPDRVGPDDILEFGARIIEEHGWVTHESGSVEKGFSIHGAVGEAARRATGTHDKGAWSARALRDETREQFEIFHGKGEYPANDEAESAEVAVGLMRAAIKGSVN